MVVRIRQVRSWRAGSPICKGEADTTTMYKKDAPVWGMDGDEFVRTPRLGIDEDKDNYDLFKDEYKKVGLLVDGMFQERLNRFVMNQGEPLDPSPTLAERQFWGSPRGIDGYRFEIDQLVYPQRQKALQGEMEAQDPIDDYFYDMDTMGHLQMRGTFPYAEDITTIFPASTLTINESNILRDLMDNMCPAQQLKAIADNCLQSPEGKADRGHCWAEHTLFILCNEAKKRYLNNRQRYLAFYTAIKGSIRTLPFDIGSDEEYELQAEPLDALRWEFYRVQYREAKRYLYKRQLAAHKKYQETSFWKRLVTPSLWWAAPAPPPQTPKHVKNYLYRGNHWLRESDITYGPPMDEETRGASIYSKLPPGIEVEVPEYDFS